MPCGKKKAQPDAVLNSSTKYKGTTNAKIRSLAEVFATADKNKTGSLDKKETQSAYHLLGCDPNPQDFDATFNAMDRDNSQNLNFDEFVTLYYTLDHNKELVQLYRQAAGPDRVMTSQEAADAINNMKCYSGDHMTAEEVQKAVGRSTGITEIEFMSLIVRDDNSWTRKQKLVWQDMTQPLQNYFIHSSHNTYLSGNQLTGKSTTDAYVSVLNQGCRCVEIDVWDGKTGNPVVTHGHTLTSKIKLREVLVAIKDNAFKKNPFPVILSIQNFCSEKQQKKMVEALNSVLGSTIATPASTGPTASPESLKGKILLKMKCLEAEELAGKQEKKSKKKKGNTTIPELLALIWMPGVSGKAVSPAEYMHTAKPNECASFSEKTALKTAEINRQAFIDMNNKTFSRIYPEGTRVKSDNFEPLPYYGLGCQMVALNFQNEAKQVSPLEKNRSIYNYNGNCGYTLKPAYLLGYNPPHTNTKCEIRVMSAHHLPDLDKGKTSHTDPFVSIIAEGPTTKREYKTRAIDENGFNPCWNEMISVDFDEDPELTTVSLVVSDKDPLKPEFIGQSTCLAASLTNGIHAIPLYDKSQQRILEAYTLIEVTNAPMDIEHHLVTRPSMQAMQEPAMIPYGGRTGYYTGPANQGAYGTNIPEFDINEGSHHPNTIPPYYYAHPPGGGVPPYYNPIGEGDEYMRGGYENPAKESSSYSRQAAPIYQAMPAGSPAYSTAAYSPSYADPYSYRDPYKAPNSSTVLPYEAVPYTFANAMAQAPYTIAPGTIAPGTIAPGTIAPGTIAPGTIPTASAVPYTVAPGHRM